MSSLQALLAKLQTEYLASIPAKIANLESLWRAGLLEEMQTEYHKLKGTGQTYGLPEITELGEVVETLCEHRKAEPTSAAIDALNRAVPLSLQILSQIRVARDGGAEYQLDEDSDFLSLVGLLPKKSGKNNGLRGSRARSS